jgi:hypothetical protein
MTAIMGAIALVAAPANAVILYDQNLTSPSATLPDPGFYNGSGNPNGGFTLDQSNGIEIGLRAKLRQNPNVIHTPTNIYDVPSGPQVSAPTRAAWNYEMSINLRPNGVGALTLNDIFPNSTLTVKDLTAGASNTVALPYWIDWATWGLAGEANLLTAATDWGMQNSQNPVFGDFPLNPLLSYDFDMNAEHFYEFTLDVRDDNARTLASDTIYVRVGDAFDPRQVPEPGTLALLGMGIIGLGFLRRRNA